MLSPGLRGENCPKSEIGKPSFAFCIFRTDVFVKYASSDGDCRVDFGWLQRTADLGFIVLRSRPKSERENAA